MKCVISENLWSEFNSRVEYVILVVNCEYQSDSNIAEMQFKWDLFFKHLLFSFWSAVCSDNKPQFKVMLNYIEHFNIVGDLLSKYVVIFQ